MSKIKSFVTKNKFLLIFCFLFTFYSVVFNSHFNKLTNSAASLLFSGTNTSNIIYPDYSLSGFFLRGVFDSDSCSSDKLTKVIVPYIYVLRDDLNQKIDAYYEGGCDSDQNQNSPSCFAQTDGIKNYLYTYSSYVNLYYRELQKYNNCRNKTPYPDDIDKHTDWAGVAITSVYQALRQNAVNELSLFDKINVSNQDFIENILNNQTNFLHQHISPLDSNIEIRSYLQKYRSIFSITTQSSTITHTTKSPFIVILGVKHNLIDGDLSFLYLKDEEYEKVNPKDPMSFNDISSGGNRIFNKTKLLELTIDNLEIAQNYISSRTIQETKIDSILESVSFAQTTSEFQQEVLKVEEEYSTSPNSNINCSYGGTDYGYCFNADSLVGENEAFNCIETNNVQVPEVVAQFDQGKSWVEKMKEYAKNKGDGKIKAQGEVLAYVINYEDGTTFTMYVDLPKGGGRVPEDFLRRFKKILESGKRIKEVIVVHTHDYNSENKDGLVCTDKDGKVVSLPITAPSATDINTSLINKIENSKMGLKTRVLIVGQNGDVWEISFSEGSKLYKIYLKFLNHEKMSEEELMILNKVNIACSKTWGEFKKCITEKEWKKIIRKWIWALHIMGVRVNKIKI